ncbi:ionotropic receptor 21a-like [Periplaneta americana]|uniref:ionotropic receptor 21a-like n=1 Tax=Periplaneta americana TaxID=6978 RepID=UPI0037E912D3
MSPRWTGFEAVVKAARLGKITRKSNPGPPACRPHIFPNKAYGYQSNYFGKPSLIQCFFASSDTKLFKYVKQVDYNEGLERLVTAIVAQTLDELNCLAVINDRAQQDIFNSQFFKTLGNVPYYKVLVEEKEDLQSPNFKTLSVIRHVKRSGCRVYILLISNGGKVSRFLKFGDRYRMLDTRAKFVLLHDKRLFHSNLHYLWKKIVNIVFLREHGRYNRPGAFNNKRIRPWYDISTVPFPTPIQKIFIPQRLDTWHLGKFHTGTDLFREKTSDLQGEQLKVVTFQHVPASVKMTAPARKDTIVEGRGPIGFGGLEIEVLTTLANALNFEPDVYEAPDADMEQWGRKQLNDSYTGLLGEVMNGNADVALGNLYYTPYYLELLDLTIPYTTECLTFLTPESLTDNSWKTLILPFKPVMWAAVVVTLFLAGFVFYALANYHHHIVSNPMHKNIIKVKEKGQATGETKMYVDEEVKTEGLYLFSELDNGILYTYGMLLLISLPKLPTGWSLRVLTGWWWIYCILVVVAYRASMTAILTNPTPRVTIDTLEKLVDSHISCGGWGEEVKEFFLTSLDTAGQKIGLKFEVIYDTDSAVERVARGQFAYYENIYFLQYLRVKRQQTRKHNKTKSIPKSNVGQGERNLHIMHDCVIHMPISIGLQKNSPLKPHMDRFLRRIIEAGLVKKWLKDVMLNIVSNDDTQEEVDDDKKALMDLPKLYMAFVALGIGYLLSICALIAEQIHWQCIVKKDPLYDKYAINIYYDHKKSLKRIIKTMSRK